jgi:hypothetical protein
MIDHIQKSCGLGAIEWPTIIYENNAACVAQQTRYIKTNYTKHISLKLFYPLELHESGEITIMQIKPYHNIW